MLWRQQYCNGRDWPRDWHGLTQLRCPATVWLLLVGCQPICRRFDRAAVLAHFPELKNSPVDTTRLYSRPSELPSELVLSPLLGGRDDLAHTPDKLSREVHVRRDVELGDDRGRELERGQERLAARVEDFVALEVDVEQPGIRALDRLDTEFGHSAAAHTDEPPQ